MNLAYLAIVHHEEKFGGGLLITDERGFPLEFRYTLPLQPSKLQRILYGQSLVPFVKVEVIGKNLLKEAKEPYNIVLVNDDTLFQLQPHTERPIIAVKETKLPPLESVWERVKENEFLFQPSEVESPIRVFFADGTRSEEVREMLETVSSTMKIAEPFKRVEEAVKAVITEKSKEGV